MSENEINTPAGGIDPLKMRNTETAALKRMPPNASPASAAARKTIKLKPLAPSSSPAARETVKLKPIPAENRAEQQTAVPTATVPLSKVPSPAASATPSRPVPPPTILLNKKTPASPAPSAESAPQFMSTNTAPVNKIVAPKPASPLAAAELGEKPSALSTATVSISRMKPAAPVSGEKPSASSTATVSISRMKPAAPVFNMPGAAAPKKTAEEAAPQYVSTATSHVPPMGKPTVGSPIKPGSLGAQPQYVSTATTHVPAMPKPEGGAPLKENELNTNTQGMRKQSEAIAQAKMQSGLQGSKPAVKLRPSASPSAESVTASSPTIRLTPKTESAVTPVPPPASAGKADDVTVTTRIPRKPFKPMAAPQPSAAPAPAPEATPAPAPEAAPAPAPAPEASAAEAPAAPKAPRLKLEKNQEPAKKDGPGLKVQDELTGKVRSNGNEGGEQVITQAKDETDKAAADASAEKGKRKNEPNLFFAICAILAFLVIGYTVFALAAQFLNTWEQQNIPVVGFEQLNQK